MYKICVNLFMYLLGKYTKCQGNFKAIDLGVGGNVLNVLGKGLFKPDLPLKYKSKVNYYCLRHIGNY